MNAIWKPAAAGNYGNGRSLQIGRITFHHIVGDAPAAIQRFQTAGTEVSAHYVIGSDGTLYQCVDEANTAYCDGSADSNSRTISIEHAGGTSSVPYTDAMYATSAELVRYLVGKYGIGDFQRHRDVIDKTAYPGGTACPGQLDVERIVNAAKGEQPMTKQEAVAILDSFFGRLAERKVKESELDEYVPLFLAGNPDKFFQKASNFDEVITAMARKAGVVEDQTQALVQDVQALIDKYKK